MTARRACALLLGAGLAACASAPAVPPALPAAAAAPGGGVAADATDDWHVLERAAFGTPLQAMAFPLHEVLLFHDADHDAADARDCYGIDGAAPRFLGAVPDVYILCFERDRLTRVEASVMLPPATAPARFARACALWLEHAAAALPPVPVADGKCAGRDRGVAWSARLAGADEPVGRVSMTLSFVAEH